MSSPRRRGVRAPSLLLTLIGIGCSGSPKDPVTDEDDPPSVDAPSETTPPDHTTDQRGSPFDSPDYGGTEYSGSGG